MGLFVREMTEDATVISETVAPQAVIHCSLSGKIAGFVRKNAGSNPASVFSIHTRISVVCPTMGVWMRALIGRNGAHLNASKPERDVLVTRATFTNLKKDSMWALNLPSRLYKTQAVKIAVRRSRF